MRNSVVPLAIAILLAIASARQRQPRIEATTMAGSSIASNASTRDTVAHLPLVAAAFDLHDLATGVPPTAAPPTDILPTATPTPTDARPTRTATTTRSPTPTTTHLPPVPTRTPTTARPTPTFTDPWSCPPPTWPAPTRTPLPMPTGQWLRDAWPDAVLELPDGRRQVAAVDPDCRPSGDCGGDAAIVTSTQPITLTSPARLRLSLPAPLFVEDLRMHVSRVTSEQADRDEFGGLLLWYPTLPYSPYDLLYRQDQDVLLARDPGMYLLAVYARWSSLEGTVYGFLVEVQP